MSVMTPQKIQEFGEALYGPAWMGLLAQRLGTTKKTIQRWKAGQNNPPKRIIDELGQLVDEQIAILCKLKDEIHDDFRRGI